MNVNIDLGSKGPECCMDAVSDSKSEVYYPSFHYSGEEDLDIPREGTMTVRYRMASKTESQGRNGDEHYSCTIDVLEIVSADGREPKKSAARETEDALDALAREKEEE